MYWRSYHIFLFNILKNIYIREVFIFLCKHYKALHLFEIKKYNEYHGNEHSKELARNKLQFICKWYIYEYIYRSVIALVLVSCRFHITLAGFTSFGMFGYFFFVLCTKNMIGTSSRVAEYDFHYLSAVLGGLITMDVGK